MNANIRAEMARVMMDDRVRAAAERRRAAGLAEALREPFGAPGRQRALVRLSLLVSRRAEPAADRRRA